MTTIETVRQTIGHCNYYMHGTFEAQAIVQKQLDQAGIMDWKAGHSHHAEAIPHGAVQVGQVKVRHGDLAHPLWVRPALSEVTN